MNTSKIILLYILIPTRKKTFNIMNRENKDVKYRKLVLFPVCDYLVLVIFLPPLSTCPVPSQCQPLPTSDIGRSLSLQEVPTLASPAQPSPAQPSKCNCCVIERLSWLGAPLLLPRQSVLRQFIFLIFIFSKYSPQYFYSHFIIICLNKQRALL